MTAKPFIARVEKSNLILRKLNSLKNRVLELFEFERVAVALLQVMLPRS